MGRHVRRGVLFFCVFLVALAPKRAWSARRESTDDTALLELDPNDLVGRATVGRAVPAAAVGETWVSVGGFRKQTMSGDEVGALLVLGLPLDRMTRRGDPQSGGPRDVAISAAWAGRSPVEISRVRVSAPLPGAQMSRDERGHLPKLARAAVDAAWRAAGLGSDDARLDAVVTRARWSAILPETRLRAIRFDDQRLYTETTTEVSRLRDSAGANLGLEARLTWRLDRLLYADDEPAFERMRLERHDARARIAGRVLEALFHWHRALLELRLAETASREAHDPSNLPSRDETDASLRVAEAEATLDVLTHGWFTVRRPSPPDPSRTVDRASPPAPSPSSL